MQILTVLDLIIEMAALFEALWNKPIEFQDYKSFAFRPGFRRSISYFSETIDRDKMMFYRYIIDAYAAYIDSKIFIFFSNGSNSLSHVHHILWTESITWYMNNPFEKFLWSSKNEMIGALFYFYLQNFSNNWKIVPSSPYIISLLELKKNDILIIQQKSVDSEMFHHFCKDSVLSTVANLIRRQLKTGMNSIDFRIDYLDPGAWQFDFNIDKSVLVGDDSLIFSADRKIFYHLTCALFLQIEQ